MKTINNSKPSKTRISALMLGLIVATAPLSAAIGTAQTTTAQLNVSFSDVEEGLSTYVAISYLANNGLVEGYEDGEFKHYQDINRAESLKLLMSALPGQTPLDEVNTTPLVEDPLEFPDVFPSEWYFSFIERAWENALVKGYPDGKFHPEQTINVAEALKIALIQEGGPIPAVVEENPYTDVPVDAWYAPYAKVAKERTIFLESRSNGSLGPSETMTRGDFARMMYRIIRTKQGARFARATWYGRDGVNWGTASGEKFDTYAMTAAHKELPFGTMLRVTNLANGKTVEVKVNDRGPYPTGLDLDLTREAFAKIADIGTGVITTEYEIIGGPGFEEESQTTEEEQLPETPVYGF